MILIFPQAAFEITKRVQDMEIRSVTKPLFFFGGGLNLVVVSMLLPFDVVVKLWDFKMMDLDGVSGFK